MFPANPPNPSGRLGTEKYCGTQAGGVPTLGVCSLNRQTSEKRWQWEPGGQCGRSHSVFTSDTISWDILHCYLKFSFSQSPDFSALLPLPRCSTGVAPWGAPGPVLGPRAGTAWWLRRRHSRRTVRSCQMEREGLSRGNVGTKGKRWVPGALRAW